MSYLGPIPGEDPVCEECGAQQHGPARPYGGHFSFCGLFSAQAYLDDQKAEADAWAASQEGIDPRDFDDPNPLPY